MKHSKYIAVFLLTLSLAGCKKFLDQQPISTIPSSNFWKTDADAQAGIAGVYNGLQGALNGGRFIEWGDARSDNFTAGGTGSNQVDISLNGQTSLTGNSTWATIYAAIGRANAAIKYIPTMTAVTAANKNLYLSQAYAARALMYFWAVRLWGDVPVRTQPYEQLSESTALARTPADSVLNNVILPDLQKALSMSDPNSGLNAFYIGKGPILAMLTDVYMWQKNYDNVLATSAQLLAKPFIYGIAANTSDLYRSIFLDPVNSREAIFFLNWNAVQNGSNSSMAAIGSGSHTSNYYIDSSVYMRFQSVKADIRRAVTYDTVLSNKSLPIQQIAKFYPVVLNKGNLSMPTDVLNQAFIPIYRIADILLLRAEAFNQKGDSASAFAIVNNIRTTRKLPALSSGNYPGVLDREKAILDERQLELFAEGKRWFDLERTGRVIGVMDPILKYRQAQRGNTPIGFGDPRKILWPISRDVLTRNPLLVQNPPYSE